MRPISLELEGFLSYGERTRIEFEGVTFAVISGPNGAGKSAMCDAIRWALFGATRSGIDSVITLGKQACSVEFTFRLGDDLYCVTRSRGKNKSLLTFAAFDGNQDEYGTPGGWTPLDRKTVTDTQALIEETLHLDDALFVMTACAAQGRADEFALARPGERKEVLARILGLEEWDTLETKARESQRATTGEIASIETAIATARESAEGAEQIELELKGARRLGEDLGGQLEGVEKQVAEARTKREADVVAQQADVAKREHRDQLAVQATDAGTKAAALHDSRNELLELADRVGDFTKRIDAAESAEKRAALLEAVRRDGERLGDKVTTAKGAYDQAVARHQGAIRTAEARVGETRTAQAERVAGLRQQIGVVKGKHEAEVRHLTETAAVLRSQTSVIDEVPCQRPEALTGVSDAAARECLKCPLLDQARAAREQLPPLEADLALIQEQEPWAATEAQLKAALADDSAAALRQQIAELKAGDPEEVTEARKAHERAQKALAAVSYDEAEHAKARAIAATLPALRKQEREAAEANARLGEIETNLAAAEAEHSRLVATLADLDDELGEPKDWTTLIAAHDAAITAAQAQVTDLRTQREAAQQQVARLERDLEQAQAAAARAEELEARRKALADDALLKGLLVKAFGPNGVPAALIDEAIPEIERVANELLGGMTNGTLWVSLQTQRERKSGAGMIETLDITIHGPAGEVPFENFSGGERVRVSVALRFALSSLLATRAGANMKLAIFDEAAAPLDPEGQDHFVEAMATMVDRYGIMALLVTHVERLRDRAPFRYEVTKHDGGSHVQLIAA